VALSLMPPAAGCPAPRGSAAHGGHVRSARRGHVRSARRGHVRSARRGHIPPARRSWLALGLAGAAIGMLPWLAYLAVSLPASPTAWHWPAAWVGLDAMEAVGLFGTGILLLRRDGRARLTAAGTAALLLADAWIDVTTAPPGSGELTALLMALLAELPAAAVCIGLAIRGPGRLAGGGAGHNPDRSTGWQSAPADRLGAVRVLVLGSGGREHALVRSLSLDPGVSELHAATGNPGIGELAVLHKVAANDAADVAALGVRLAADLVVIGPEAPLVAGVADAVRAAGISCFGPGQDAAMIEGSKSFAKDIMSAAGVPTAAARTCRTSGEVAAALDEFGPPFVVKADGLAAGKGVVVTSDRQAAALHARACGTVVIEEFLDGPEVSVFALTDGRTAVPLLPAQDYKRARDGDEGPNTGGMGAYAPLSWAPADLAEETLVTVVEPALAELGRRGTPFSGLLYTGLCLTTRGLRVVEFNARFGDPETQVVLDRLVTPLGELLRAAAEGDLATAPVPQWAQGAAVAVVIAAEGYPASPVGGDLIDGIAKAAGVPGAYVLQAGTSVGQDGQLAAAGGRVLNVIGTGTGLTQARSVAYQAAAEIRMRGGWYRHDIAEKPAAGTATGL
jgi:phosphoribosylamine---glycine ligase